IAQAVGVTGVAMIYMAATLTAALTLLSFVIRTALLGRSRDLDVVGPLCPLEREDQRPRPPGEVGRLDHRRNKVRDEHDGLADGNPARLGLDLDRRAVGSNELPGHVHWQHRRGGLAADQAASHLFL